MGDLMGKGVIVQGTFVNGCMEIINVPYVYDRNRSEDCVGYLTSGVIRNIAYITRYMVDNSLEEYDYEYFFTTYV